MLKHCKKCGKDKPATAEYFYSRGGNIEGLRSPCRACKREYARAYQKENGWSGYAQDLNAASRSQKERHRRDTLIGFTAYMLENPVYFWGLSKGKRNTPRNIRLEFEKIKNICLGETLRELIEAKDVRVY